MYEKYKLRSRWVKMLSRCEDDDNPEYRNYGARGIKVCTEWHEFSNFYNWCMQNNFSNDFQLDRANNDGNYEPSNCRFVSREENSRNKRNNRMLSAFDETKSMAEWAEDERCVVSYRVLQKRINDGWNVEDSLTKKLYSTVGGKIPHNSVTLHAFGETKTRSEWIKDDRCSVGYRTIWWRLTQGWSTEDAISKPGRKKL